MAQRDAAGDGEAPRALTIGSIPALHLHYGHGLLAELERRGPITLRRLIDEADDVESLFKSERQHRGPLERARQLMRYAQELGLVQAGRTDLWLTPPGQEYVSAGSSAAVFSTTEEQRAILRDQLAVGVQLGAGIPTGAALTLELLADMPGAPAVVIGRALAERGGASGWRERRTFQAQGERYLALVQDAGLVQDDGAPNDNGRELAALLARAHERPTGVPTGRTALHLVLKWSARLEPDTIELHRDVARAHGAVWWGRQSRAGVTGLARKWVERLRRQVADEIATYVFLRGETTWRARLLDVTTDRADIDERLVPAYYDPATHHSLWVKLTDFEQVDQQEIIDGYVQENGGGPVTERGLGNQTPIILRGPAIRVPVGTPGRSRRSTRRARPPARPLDLATLRAAAERRGLRLPQQLYAHVAAVLRSGKHVILTGPPGTAKTTFATAIAEAAETVGMCAGHLPTTATADWTTYETIGGLRPTNGGSLAFEEGHFLTAIGQERWLLIDELNRSQFDRAFGQLFTVLSGHRVELPYRRDEPGAAPIALVPHGAEGTRDGFDPIAIPRDWRIVATMNVFDKTLLFDMSFALMRRFAFVEVPSPDDATFGELIDRRAGNERAAALARRLLVLRTLKDIGPAVYMDLAAFLAERIGLEEAEDEQLLFEAFYSYLLPQFEGVPAREGDELHAILGRLVGPAHRARLRRTLSAVLGLELEEGQPDAP